MSTIQEIISRVDEIKPNAFSERIKLKWLNDLEGKIAADVFLMNIHQIRELQYKWPEDMETEPLVGYPHDDVYDYWLSAKIDFENGEYDKYQNTMLQYNECYSNFVRWFTRNYEPANGWPDDHCAQHPEKPSYYITAYGLAVLRGFRGTVDDWLATIKGEVGDTGGYYKPQLVQLGSNDLQMSFLASREDMPVAEAFDIRLPTGPALNLNIGGTTHTDVPTSDGVRVTDDFGVADVPPGEMIIGANGYIAFVEAVAANVQTLVGTGICLVGPKPENGKDYFTEKEKEAFRQEVVDAVRDSIYPVGSIYMSISPADPAALFGGTWERIKDTFLLSAGDKYAPGAVGGEAEHVLTEDELPAHSHSFTGQETTTGEESAKHTHAVSEKTVATASNGSHTHQSQGYWQVTGSGERCIAVNPVSSDPVVNNALLSAGEHTHNVTIPAADTGENSAAHTHKVTAKGKIGETGSGKAHNNLPPYLAVYMWQRTA